MVGVREGKAHVQGKSRTGKIFAKKASTGEVLAKKNSVAGRVPVGKATPVVKKVYAEPVCRQGPRQESGSEPREQSRPVARQAYGDGVRKRQENAASRDKEGQGIFPENPFRTKNQQMKAEPNSSETESSRR